MASMHPVVGGGNGQPPSTATDPIIAKILLGYEECARRDTNAERMRDRLASVARWVILAFLVLLGVFVWREVSRKPVEAFVQVVVQDEQGNYVLSGLPQHLLEYTPAQGQYMEMLAEWVRRQRSRGENPEYTRKEWVWVYRHSCTDARKKLDEDERDERPFVPGQTRRVDVDIKSVTKTATPESYQVLFEETTTDSKRPGKKVALWTGTFTVGRYHPKTTDVMLDNRLGLCATGYNFTEQTKK